MIEDIKVGDNVKLTKLSGEYNDDIPIGYWIKGQLTTPILLNQSIWVTRWENQYGEKLGRFNTSAIQSVDGNKLITRNSTWEIEKI